MVLQSIGADLDQVLSDVRKDLLFYLQRHLPLLSHEHEDLVNTTIYDLLKYVKREFAVAKPTKRDGNKDNREWSKDDYMRLAYRILQRRIADYFRKAAAEWGRNVNIEDISPLTNSSFPLQDRQVFYRQILAVCIQAIAEANEEERLIIAKITGANADQSRKNVSFAPLNAKQRQRLKRFRKKLDDEIRKNFGSSMHELFQHNV